MVYRGAWPVCKPRHTCRPPGKTVAWREAEYAALQAEAGDAGDDRVSGNIFDVADERTQVDIIVHGMIRGAN